MDYNQFKQELLRLLNEKKPPGISEFILDQTPVNKTNHNFTDSLQAVFENNPNMRPILYPEALFKEYQSGESLDSICSGIIQGMSESPYMKNVQLSDFNQEEAPKHLTLRLINKNLNPEIAVKCAHIVLEDLIAVPRWEIDSNASVLVDRDFSRNLLHMTDDEVLAIARKNAINQGFSITGINDVMRQMLGNAVSEDILEEMTPSKSPFYVMTNESREFGAIGLLSKDLLKKAEEVMGEKEYFVIPSSLHEALLVPASSVIDPSDLQQMCRTVNENEVAAEDILGDSIYRWNGSKLQICNDLDQLIDQRAFEKATKMEKPEMARRVKCG